MNHHPKISIVTISFNQGEYLERTIKSVLDQGYPNLEYIIIDGGSTDNSVEIIKKYESQLAYWVSEKDNGMYHAVQKGFEKSTGEIMAWINSDDCYHKNAFYVVEEIFSAYRQIEWLGAMPSIIDEADRIVIVNDMRRWSKYDFLAGNWEFIQQESCFWRRSLWERAGGTLNTSLKYAGDFALWLTFFSYAEFYCCQTILGAFRMRSKNQFSLEKMDEYRDEANKLLKIRKKNFLPGERINLIKFSFYHSILNKIPVLGLMFYIVFIERMYPPHLYFERTSMKFQFSTQIHKNFFTILKSRFKQKFKIR